MKRMVTMSLLLVTLLGMFAHVGFAADMKKVMILYARQFEFMVSPTLKSLEDAGFADQKNMIVMRVESSVIDKDVPQLVAQVKEAAPDVVVCFIGTEKFFTALQGLPFPVITRIDVERYVDADGFPLANITGVYTWQRDMVYNSYKFLQKVAPLKAGQQVVFLDNPESGILPKDIVLEALQRLQIPLKTVVNAAIYEDWQRAILQYNDDPGVGWILKSSPTRKQDGSAVSTQTDVYPWQQAHLKKPTITYWDFAVQAGTLCGFAIDMSEVGKQAGQLAARILQGEEFRTIKAEYPNKVNIALNRKTATNLGIVFSLDVLNLANVIYDDYEGKQVIRK